VSPLRRSRGPDGSYSLYYASDVHGSDQCWRKFLGAGRFYGVNALVMGGDLTGKAIVPITRGPDGVHHATMMGEVRTCRSERELDELREAIRYNGMYPWTASPADVERTGSDPAEQGRLFEQVMLAELARWIAVADERMRDSGIEVFAMAGNDDPWSCDDVLRAAAYVQFCDDRLVRVGLHEMVSCSYANPTPWNSPRELDEEALYTRLRALADQLERPERAIFNFHVPPYDSGLDGAFEIDPETLTYVLRGGRPHEVAVGSTAVRQVIEEVQPLLSLHGHIHEARAATRLGRTLAVNSGSEYNSGRIHGVIVKLDGDRVASHQLVSG